MQRRHDQRISGLCKASDETASTLQGVDRRAGGNSFVMSFLYEPMILPYWTPDGHAVSHARHSRQGQDDGAPRHPVLVGRPRPPATDKYGRVGYRSRWRSRYKSDTSRDRDRNGRNPMKGVLIIDSWPNWLGPAAELVQSRFGNVGHE